MMRIKVSKQLVSLSVIALLIAAGNYNAQASQESRVSLVFQSKENLFVPKDLDWGASSIKAASRAIAFQKNEFTRTLATLRANGAVMVVRREIPTENLHFQDWKTYISKFGQSVFEGFDSGGLSVGKSEALPTDFINLPSYLVGIKDYSCSLEPLANSKTPKCSIDVPTPQTYLRAELRTVLEHDMLADNIYYIRQQLEYCLSSGQKFTITANNLICPNNQKPFLTQKIKLTDFYLTRSYKIKVNAITRTASMWVSARDFRKVAKTAVFQGTDVIRFG
jgi:hypothetical protein